MSQHTKILNLLEACEWVCSSKFYAQYIADPRSRIAELKKKGYQLEWRWCKTHDHEGGSKEWRLIAPQTPNPAPTFTRPAVNPIAQDFLTRWQKPAEKEVKLTLF